MSGFPGETERRLYRGDNQLAGANGDPTNLSIAMTDESAWDLSATTVIEMTGGEGATIGEWSDWGVLEIAGLDTGFDPLGFQGNFSIPTLEIGADASVFLLDLLDNGNRGGTFGFEEALYVDNLVFQDSAGVLNVNGLNIYFNQRFPRAPGRRPGTRLRRGSARRQPRHRTRPERVFSTTAQPSSWRR